MAFGILQTAESEPTVARHARAEDDRRPSVCLHRATPPASAETTSEAFSTAPGSDRDRRRVHRDYVTKSRMTALRVSTSNGLAMDTFATDARKLLDRAVKAPPVMNTTLRAAAGFDLARVS